MGGTNAPRGTWVATALRTTPQWNNGEDIDHDVAGGSSGGPWFSGFDENTGPGTLNSVNGFKYGFAAGWMFGPCFGTDARAVHEAAQSAATS